MLEQLRVFLALVVLSTSAHAECYITVVGTSEYIYCNGALTSICTEVGDKKYCRSV